MKITKQQAGQYNVTNNGELIAQISDGRKFNLWDTNGMYWKIYHKDTNHRLHKQGFTTLKQAKRRFGL